MKRAFAATGDFSADAPALMTIGDSIVMVSAGPRKTTSSLLHLYVPDARTRRSGAHVEAAPPWSKSRPTCRTAIAARWLRTRSATFGKSQRIEETPPAERLPESKRERLDAGIEESNLKGFVRDAAALAHELI